MNMQKGEPTLYLWHEERTDCMQSARMLDAWVQGTSPLSPPTLSRKRIAEDLSMKPFISLVEVLTINQPFINSSTDPSFFLNIQDYPFFFFPFCSGPSGKYSKFGAYFLFRGSYGLKCVSHFVGKTIITFYLYFLFLVK